MSMQITHMRSLLQLSLPPLLLVCSISLAIWKGLQTTPLPAGSQLVLHQTLTNAPPKLPEIKQNSAKQSGSDPFFRDNKEVNAELKAISQMTNLEEIHLTTIAQGKQGRYCIINGEIFHEKQGGKGFIVDQIAGNKVDFQTSFESFILMPGQRAAIQSGKLVPLDKVASNSPVPLMEKQSLYE